MSVSLPNIALTGKLRSGKDAAAAYLCERYGYVRFAFGDGIRRVTRELYPEAYVNNTKPRALLQGFGQMARQFDENVWVNDCFRRIIEAEIDQIFDRKHGITSAKFRAVISDLRQPNEYVRCRAEGFVIVRITCPDAIRLERARAAGDAFTSADLTHETESYVDTFAVDYEIENSGTLAEFHAQIDAMMTDLGYSADG